MRPSWGAGSLVREAVKVPGNTAIVRRAPEDDLPSSLDEFDAVILSGSMTSCLAREPWTDHLDEAIRHWVERRIPLLGVCYGHQSIIRALGGVAHLRKGQSEVGWTEIEQTGESAIFEGLPRKFWTFSNHHEEAQSLPPALVANARSERCEIQAFSHVTAPVFGIQFHPEKNLPEAEETFRGYRAKGRSSILMRPKDGSKLLDATVAERIFGNFFRLAAQRTSS